MLASLTHSLVSLQSCPSSISQTAISPYNNNVLYRHKEARGQALTTPSTRPPITTPTTTPNNYHAHQPNLLITTPLLHMVGSPIRPGTPQGGHSTAPGGRGGGEDQHVCISTLRSTKKVIKSLKKRSQIKKKILAKKVRVAAMFVVTSCILMMTSFSLGEIQILIFSIL